MQSRTLLRLLLGASLLLAVGLVFLWRAIRDPVAIEATARESATPADAIRSTAMVSSTTPSSTSTSTPAAAAVSPPGGVRAWSPTATPTDGPDPFAPVPQVRSLEDTRAGLPD